MVFKIDDALWGAQSQDVDAFMAQELPLEENYNPEKWACLRDAFDPRSIAQIRFSVGDANNSLFRRGFPWTEGSYCIRKENKILERMADRFDMIANTVKMQNPSEEADKKAEPFRHMAYLFRSQEEKKEWSIKEIAVVGGLTFGLAPLVVHKSWDLVEKKIRDVFNHRRGKGGGGGPPAGGTPAGGERASSFSALKMAEERVWVIAGAAVLAAAVVALLPGEAVAAGAMGIIGAGAFFINKGERSYDRSRLPSETSHST